MRIDIIDALGDAASNHAALMESSLTYVDKVMDRWEQLTELIGDDENFKNLVTPLAARINKLKDRSSNLQSAASASIQFNEQVQNLTLQLSALDEK